MSFSLGPLALQYLVQCGGRGYFRTRVVQRYLDEGVLKRVEQAPEFSHPVYLVYSRANRSAALAKAISLVRELAVGEFTEPVRTPPGFIIVKVLEKRGGETQVRDEVHVRHILIKPSAIRSEDEARLLVKRLRERILAGEDFAELARNFSEDPGSALNGGDLNWIDPNSLVPEFRQVMANTASGELSQPFQSPYGWHILEVLGRRATDTSEEFREQQARNLLRNRRYDEELQAWLRQIRDEAYVEIKL